MHNFCIVSLSNLIKKKNVGKFMFTFFLSNNKKIQNCTEMNKMETHRAKRNNVLVQLTAFLNCCKLGPHQSPDTMGKCFNDV